MGEAIREFKKAMNAPEAPKPQITAEQKPANSGDRV
jgi:Sec-independent protein translocase protein TatA